MPKDLGYKPTRAKNVLPKKKKKDSKKKKMI